MLKMPLFSSKKSDLNCTVSIIIPVYNTAEYLSACLDSVIGQSFEDFEVILVDDGSTDGSLGIERAYAVRDTRFKVIEQFHMRQGAARNLGLSAARGEYVYFMDSDDVIEPDLLEACFERCSSQELDFVTFDCEGFLEVPGDAPELHEATVFDRLGSCSQAVSDGVSFWFEHFPKYSLPFVCWLQFFKRSFLVENDLRFIEGVFYEDCDWTLRVYMNARRIAYIPRALYNYRKRQGSVVNSKFGKNHAKSCLTIHSALSRIMRSCDESQRQMVLDTSRIIDHRLDQFEEIVPDDDLTDCVIQFEKRLLEDALDDCAIVDCKHLELETLLHLDAAVSSWKIETVIDCSSVIRLMFPDFPLSLKEARLGVYGTGKISSFLMENLGTECPSLVFLMSDASHNSTFCNYPVLSIERAEELGLESIVIASTRYHAEMEATARRVAPSAYIIVPDVVAARLILRFAEAGNVRIGQ